jgi:hypothetical protein
VAGTVLAQDTFQRPNQTFWGTSSSGNAWSGYANSSSAFSIVSNGGQITGINGPVDAILGPSAADAQVVFTGSLSSFNQTNLGAVLHWQDANNWYKAYISGTSLIVQRRIGGKYLTLGSAPFSASANVAYSLRFQIIGATLRARVWNASSAEPSTWMVTATDTTFSSGLCGLRIDMRNSRTARVTSFLASVP